MRADCSAEPIRSAGASTWTAPRSRRSVASASHAARASRSSAQASAARRSTAGEAPPRRWSSASVFVYDRQATPLRSSPASRSMQESTSAGERAPGTVRDAERPARAPVAPDRSERLGRAAARRDGDGEKAGRRRLRRAGRRILRVGVAAPAAEIRDGGQRRVPRAAHPEEDDAVGLRRDGVDPLMGAGEPAERGGRLEDVAPGGARARGQPSCSRSQRIPPCAAYIHEGSKSTA